MVDDEILANPHRPTGGGCLHREARHGNKVQLTQFKVLSRQCVSMLVPAAGRAAACSYAVCFGGDHFSTTDFMRSFIRVAHNPQCFEVKLEVCL